MANTDTTTYVVAIVSDTDPTDRHEVDVTRHIGTSNYDRCVEGMCRRIDWDRYHLDSEVADKAHEEAMAARRDGGGSRMATS